MERVFAPAIVLIIAAITSSTARAEPGFAVRSQTVQLSPYEARDELEWRISSIEFPDGVDSPVSLLVADVDGDARAEIFILSASGALSALERPAGASPVRVKPLATGIPGSLISLTLPGDRFPSPCIRARNGSRVDCFSSRSGGLHNEVYRAPRACTFPEHPELVCQTNRPAGLACISADERSPVITCWEKTQLRRPSGNPLLEISFGARTSLVPFNRGAGTADAWLAMEHGYRDFVLLDPIESAPRYYAQLIRGAPWKRYLLADLNGDETTDIILYGSRFDAAAWIESTPVTGIERTLRWPFDRTVETVAGGDLNGDGFDDLAALTADGRRIVLAEQVRTRSAIAGLLTTVIAHTRVPFIAGTLPVFVAPPEHHPSSGPWILELPVGSRYTLLWSAAPGILLHRTRGEIDLTATGRQAGRSPIVLVFEVEPSGHIGPTGKEAIYGAPFGDSPRVCIGYNPTPQFSSKKWGALLDLCPSNYAIFGANEGFGPAETSIVAASCCPLPHGDILKPETVFVDRQCPDGWVITGTDNPSRCPDCARHVRCTKVNDDRFELGPASAGVYWGQGGSMRFQSARVQRFEIPASIRDGVTRQTFAGWGVDGCIGVPFGSLLVSKGGRRCDQSEYRPLLYRGLPGDPPRGTPVEMYPDCAVDNVYDPASGCAAPSRAKR